MDRSPALPRMLQYHARGNPEHSSITQSASRPASESRKPIPSRRTLCKADGNVWRRTVRVRRTRTSTNQHPCALGMSQYEALRGSGNIQQGPHVCKGPLESDAGRSEPLRSSVFRTPPQRNVAAPLVNRASHCLCPLQACENACHTASQETRACRELAGTSWYSRTGMQVAHALVRSSRAPRCFLCG